MPIRIPISSVIPSVKDGKIRIHGLSAGSRKYLAALKDDAVDMRLAMNGVALYNLKGITIYTAPGSAVYATPDGVTALLVECWGGGGAGGGCVAGATNGAAGGGGAGGGYSAKWLTASIVGNHDVVVGAGGTGSSGANGNAGGATSFEDTLGAIVVSAAGGPGGVVDTVGIATKIGGPGGSGAAGSGDVGQHGAPGETGLCLVAAQVISGAGGRSAFLGSGAPGVKNASAAGTNADGYGGGGSGAAIISGVAGNRAGGNGANGLMIIWEFM